MNSIWKRNEKELGQKIRIIGMALMSSLILWSCSDSSSNKYDAGPLPVSILALQQPENCDGLRDYISQSIIKRNTTIGRRDYYWCGTTGVPQPGPVPTDPVTVGGGTSADTALRTPDGVSDTNNQEQGVNESDIVKADANGFIYMISGTHFIVAKGFPPSELTTLKEVDLGMHATHLFLDKSNQRAVVFGRQDPPYYIRTVVADPAAIVQDPLSYDETAAVFFDVSVPAEPKLVDQLRFSGYFQEGRRIDNRLHIILRDYYNPDVVYRDREFWDLQQAFWSQVNKIRCANPDTTVESIEANPAVIEAKQNLVAKVSLAISSISDDELVPTASRLDNTGARERLPYLACTDVNYPNVEANLGLQVLSSMDTDAKNLSATAVVNTAWQVYSSKDSLYMAEVSSNWWWRPVSGNDLRSQTAIYKFSISSGRPQYVATGVVPGISRNQFSFSEHNNVLRVATTEDDWLPPVDNSSPWRRMQQNNVFVLADDGAGALTVKGSVRGFGKDERIQSSRFIGDRGYVVTFRNIDPLFSFDLSDPTDPKLMGELTIPGFSRYMHPYDENHLITIGRGGDNTGVVNGMQLQLFDVTDLSNPVLLHAFMPNTPSGWSWSTAEYDHKAFTFYKPRNLLAIPVQYPPTNTTSVFNGIVAYDVSLESGFTELGRVDHADLAREYYCAPGVSLIPPYGDYCDNGWYVQWAAPRRSVVMTSGLDTYLYSISDVGVKASDVSDLSVALGTLLFPPQPYPFWYFGMDFRRILPAIPADGVVVANPAVSVTM